MKKRLLGGLLALMLLVSLWIPAAAASLPFRDVSTTDWFYSYVSELYRKKMVNGTDATHFSPNGTVSLGQALKLVLLAAGYGEQKPVDDHWASGYFALAKQKGLLPAGRFNTLNSPINRLQIAELAVKALGLSRTKTTAPFSDTKESAALIAWDHGIFTGVQEGRQLFFKPAATITRAEISAVALRVYQKKAATGTNVNNNTTSNNSDTYILFGGTKVYVCGNG